MVDDQSAGVQPTGSGQVSVWNALRQDLVIPIAAPVFLLSMLPYFVPILSEDAQVAYADLYGDFPVLIMAMAAFQYGLRAVEDDRGRRFWNLWTAAFGLWFIIRLLYAAVPIEIQDHRFGILTDLLYLGFYFLIVVALDLTEPGTRPRDMAATAVASGTIITAFGLLGYFAVIPGAINPEIYETSVPSLLLYMVLDLYVLSRLLQLWRGAADNRWRRVYGWLALTASFWFLTDTVEVFQYMEVIPQFWPGTLLDLLWYVPAVTVVVAARVRTHSLPATPTGDRKKPDKPLGQARLWGGSLVVYAFMFALIHSAVETMGIMDAETRMARNILVLCVLGILLALAIRRERLLEQRTRVAAAREVELQLQLRQAQKMEAIGILAGGVAHDFNNILTGIVGHAELARVDLDRNSSAADDLDEIGRLSDRAADLVRQLLAFSRRQALNPVVLDVNSLIKNMTKMLRRMIGEQIDLDCDLDPNPIWTRADAGQIEQVLMNLAVNSRDSMLGGGTLTIRTATVSLDEAFATGLGMQPGLHVLLSVTDTGSGMDEETCQRIFEPFFTTKEPGKGTGLGLSTVYGIIQQHEGHITVESSVGRGTTFRVYLPSVNEEDSAQAKEKKEDSPRGTETILVAEDEVRITQLVKRFLTNLGYQVYCANSPKEAEELFRQHGDEIDLLLTDVVMPEQSGVELYEKLVQELPALKVLYMSGYSGKVDHLSEMSLEGMPFLPKPFRPVDLAVRIREVLNR